MVSQLNQQQAAEVEDIITSPPDQDPYDRLKAELVRRLSTSREQRVRQLLSHEEMGDQKTITVPPVSQGPSTRRPRRFSAHHLGQPTPTTRASHTCRSDRGQSGFSLAPRGPNLRGHSAAYHSKRLWFDARYYSRPTRAY